MCDAMSLAAGIADFGSGLAASIEARGKSDFEARQIEAMAVLAGANANREQGDVTRAFHEQMRTNIASAAMSGLNPASFAAVFKGNEAELKRQGRAIHAALKIDQGNMDTAAAEARIAGMVASRSALFSGAFNAIDQLAEADRTYRDTNTGESRMDAFWKSLRY